MMLLLGFVPGNGFGQFFTNPSFEGTPGISIPPPSWQAFDENSTPDTDPVACYNFQASDGETYLTLVTRGEGHEFPGTSENITTTFLQPVEQGKYYSLSVDLASRDDVGHFTWTEGFSAYTAPVILRIYGSEGKPDKGELLAESAEITLQEWSSFSFILIPQETATWLILEVIPAQGTYAWGNLLLDHLEMEELDELPLDLGELIIPNVFTPNGDGINDELVIRGLRSESSLLVYDRTSKEVFSSSNYEQNWDGKDKSGEDLPADTYWYILLPSHLPDVYKGFIYLKRE
jgi:gliding motility-associated-like protein